MVVSSVRLPRVAEGGGQYGFKRSVSDVSSGRGAPVTFHFNGRAIEALAGDTIASALYRAGQRIFSRSFKYHRPRGLLCCLGKCPNCMMNVNGIPHVRTCVTPVREGAEVRHQNAYPSLETDFLS